MGWLRKEKSTSERLTCRSVRQPRATQSRLLRGRIDRVPEVETRLVELAQPHAAWGCPKLHRQLRHEGPGINHKRTKRLCQQHGLSIRRRRRRRLVWEIRNPLLQPIRPSQCWSMDFMGDSLADGRSYRTFNVIDDCVRDGLAIEIDVSSTAQRVLRVLDPLYE
jgi:putative transposase